MPRQNSNKPCGAAAARTSSCIQPLQQLTCVGCGYALQAVQQLAHAAHAAGGGGGGRADVDSTVALVSLRELEGKVSRIEHVQASDSRRVGGCEAALTQLQQELLAARAEVRSVC